MEMWEKLLLGVLGLLLILWFRPGLKAALEQSKRAEQKDWKAVVVPVTVVVLFVIFVIYIT
jgi:hypothetical protein